MNPRFKTLMPTIEAWLNANDIPAGDVSIKERPSIADGRITVRVCKRRDGRFYIDPETDDIATEVRTVPLKVEPPAELTPWLRGQVRP